MSEPKKPSNKRPSEEVAAARYLLKQMLRHHSTPAPDGKFPESAGYTWCACCGSKTIGPDGKLRLDARMFAGNYEFGVPGEEGAREFFHRNYGDKWEERVSRCGKLEDILAAAAGYDAFSVRGITAARITADQLSSYFKKEKPTILELTDPDEKIPVTLLFKTIKDPLGVNT